MFWKAKSPSQGASPVPLYLSNGPQREGSRRQPEGGLVYPAQLWGKEGRLREKHGNQSLLLSGASMSPLRATERKYNQIPKKGMIRKGEH